MSQPAVERSMQGKVCLVTGATSGIGRVTALELARAGGQVLGVGRTPERAAAAAEQIRQATNNPSVSYLAGDLSSQAEIRRLAQEILARTQRLDLLINNAGGIYLTREGTVDGMEMTFAVNHLAYFVLTNLLLSLKDSAPSRIVNVASAAHRGCSLNLDDLQGKSGRYSPWRAYQRSKLANILFTRELAQRLEGTGVRSTRFIPVTSIPRSFAEGFRGWLLRRFADLFAISPERGALNSLFVATSSEVEGISGKYFVNQKVETGSSQSRDLETAHALWDKSMELTGLDQTI